MESRYAAANGYENVVLGRSKLALISVPPTLGRTVFAQRARVITAAGDRDKSVIYWRCCLTVIVIVFRFYLIQPTIDSPIFT